MKTNLIASCGLALIVSAMFAVNSLAQDISSKVPPLLIAPTTNDVSNFCSP